MPSMLRFRRGRRSSLPATPAPEGPPAMSTILVTGASGFVGSHVVPSLLAGGPPGRRARPDARRRARWSSARAARATSAQDVEIRIGDVTRPGHARPGAWPASMRVVHLAAIPRDFNGGADLRLVNTEGTRAVVAAMREAGVRRLVHMGAMGVADDPTLHYASSKAKAEALVRDSGLGWTILKPSLQFGEGDGFFNIIAGLVRLSPGVVPVPGDGDGRFQPIHVDDVAAVVVRVARGPDRRSAARSSSAGRATGRTARSPARSSRALGKRRADPADAGPAHPARGGDRGTRPPPVPGRHRPAPPARARQHRPARRHPVAVRLHAAPDGGRARLPQGRGSATRSPSRSDRPIARPA